MKNKQSETGGVASGVSIIARTLIAGTRTAGTLIAGTRGLFCGLQEPKPRWNRVK